MVESVKQWQAAFDAYLDKRHVVVYGQPGSGKTDFALRVFRDACKRHVHPRPVTAPTAPIAQPVLLAPTRRRADRLNMAPETVAARWIRPAHTPMSLAFQIVSLWFSSRSNPLPPPALFTGADEDAYLAQLLKKSQVHWPYGVDSYVVELDSFRSQLRELFAQCETYQISADQLRDFGKAANNPMWIAASQLLDDYSGRGSVMSQAYRRSNKKQDITSLPVTPDTNTASEPQAHSSQAHLVSNNGSDVHPHNASNTVDSSDHRPGTGPYDDVELTDEHFLPTEERSFFDSVELQSVAAQIIKNWDRDRQSEGVNAERPHIPVLIVDDAHDCGYPTFHLLMALAQTGTQIVALTNPDESVNSYRGAHPFLADHLHYLKPFVDYIGTTRMKPQVQALYERLLEQIPFGRHSQLRDLYREHNHGMSVSLEADSSSSLQNTCRAEDEQQDPISHAKTHEDNKHSKKRINGRTGEGFVAKENSFVGLNSEGDSSHQADRHMQDLGSPRKIDVVVKQSHELAQRNPLRCVLTHSSDQQAIYISNYLRRAYFAESNEKEALNWSDMMVVCRTQNEVHQLRTLLANYGVELQDLPRPIILAQHPGTKPLIDLFRLAAEIEDVTSKPDASSLLTKNSASGVLSGVDESVSARKSDGKEPEDNGESNATGSDDQDSRAGGESAGGNGGSRGGSESGSCDRSAVDGGFVTTGPDDQEPGGGESAGGYDKIHRDASTASAPSATTKPSHIEDTAENMAFPLNNIEACQEYFGQHIDRLLRSRYIGMTSFDLRQLIKAWMIIGETKRGSFHGFLWDLVVNPQVLQQLQRDIDWIPQATLTHIQRAADMLAKARYHMRKRTLRRDSDKNIPLHQNAAKHSNDTSMDIASRSAENITAAAVDDTGDTKPRVTTSSHNNAPRVTTGQEDTDIPAVQPEIATEQGDIGVALWDVWSAARCSHTWRRAALQENGALSRIAHEDLNAVMTLFRTADIYMQRHENADIGDFIDTLLSQNVRVDNLTASHVPVRGVEVVTTAEAAGKAKKLVVVTGLQHDIWPRALSFGSLFAVPAFIDTVHQHMAGAAPTSSAHVMNMNQIVEEYRAFALALSRSSGDVVVCALSTDSMSPSRFHSLACDFGVREDYTKPTTPPLVPLSLKGLVGRMRRQLTAEGHTHNERRQASEVLAILAHKGVEQAEPKNWTGAAGLTDSIVGLSTDKPLFDDQDIVEISPSHIESMSRCGLRWLLSRYCGTSQVGSEVHMGTIIHSVAERAVKENADTQADLMRIAQEEGLNLDPRDVRWHEAAEQKRAREILANTAEYFAAVRDPELFAATYRSKEPQPPVVKVEVERPVKQQYENNVIYGRVDRLEHDEAGRVRIVDLKTGTTPPTRADADENPQLRTYQLLVHDDTNLPLAGARLVYPGTGKSQATVLNQSPLDDESVTHTQELIAQAGRIARSDKFRAQYNSYCDTCEFRHCCPLQPEGKRTVN